MVAAGLLDVEGAAAEGRRFDGDGQQRQRLLDGCINKALVIRRGVGDHLVQVVVIADLHAIEVVIIVVGQFFDRICGLDAAGVQRAEAHSGHGHNSQHPHSNAGGKFHSGSLLLVIWPSMRGAPAKRVGERLWHGLPLRHRGKLFFMQIVSHNFASAQDQLCNFGAIHKNGHKKWEKPTNGVSPIHDCKRDQALA